MKTSIFNVVAMVLALSAPVLTFAAQSTPRTGEIALVIASPFGPPIDQILTAANLREMHPNRAPLGAFVYLDHPRSYDLLKNEGAWFVLRGEEILKLC